MVKKKGKSKRTTLKDKYKIQKRVAETGRKRKKEARRDAKNGITKPHLKKKDPGIPNSWPFKQDLLKEIQRSRERQQQLEDQKKQNKKEKLRALREHQASGGSARTIEELMSKVSQTQAEYAAKQGGTSATIAASGTTSSSSSNTSHRSDGSVAAGQQSRRAYLRELKKVVDTADVLLQVLDARDPVASRIHPTLEEAILSQAEKRMVLVLNKIDLVPKEVIGRWLTVLRRSHPAIAVKASGHRKDDDSTIDAAHSTSAVGMEAVLQLLKNYARTGGTGGKAKTTIVVGIIGYPNVGKSSIINALKRTRAVGVSPRPGFTTSMQEVVLDRNVRLLDSPGVVFDDKSALLGNCVDADSVDDPVPAIDALLKRCDPKSLIMTYNIPAFPPGNTMMFLAMVARTYGRVLKGGIPDKIAAARAVLKDWNNGKIPYFTTPPADADQVTQSSKGQAVIVSTFGAEFDLSKYDNSILDSLKDKDEMDFVQLSDSNLPERDAEAGKMANLLQTLQEGDDEDMEQDDNGDDSDSDAMDDQDEAPRSAGSRGQLADAEDFNFNDL